MRASWCSIQTPSSSEDALGCPDADDPDDGSDGEPDEGTAADVIGWVEPGDEGDVRRHTPDDSQWWFYESPDQLHRGVQRMGHGGWRELDDQGLTLVGFGRTPAGEIAARSHLATEMARARSPSDPSLPPPFPPPPPSESSLPPPPPDACGSGALGGGTDARAATSSLVCCKTCRCRRNASHRHA